MLIGKKKGVQYGLIRPGQTQKPPPPKKALSIFEEDADAPASTGVAGDIARQAAKKSTDTKVFPVQRKLPSIMGSHISGLDTHFRMLILLCMAGRKRIRPCSTAVSAMALHRTCSLPSKVSKAETLWHQF